MITKKEVREANLKLESAKLELEYLRGNVARVNRLLSMVQEFLDRVEAEVFEEPETTVGITWTPEEILAREG